LAYENEIKTLGFSDNRCWIIVNGHTRNHNTVKKHLEEQLVAQYPDILADYGGPKEKTCMHWGMEHGDGWYDLLDNLMRSITIYCNQFDDADRPQVLAAQIKQKFGELCFYVDIKANNQAHHDNIRQMIAEAEEQSKHICEITGLPGELHRSHLGYFRTLSPEAAKDLEYTPAHTETPYPDENPN
jgi:hypothetical protein